MMAFVRKFVSDGSLPLDFSVLSIQAEHNELMLAGGLFRAESPTATLTPAWTPFAAGRLPHAAARPAQRQPAPPRLHLELPTGSISSPDTIGVLVPISREFDFHFTFFDSLHETADWLVAPLLSPGDRATVGQLASAGAAGGRGDGGCGGEGSQNRCDGLHGHGGFARPAGPTTDPRNMVEANRSGPSAWHASRLRGRSARADDRFPPRCGLCGKVRP